MASKNLVVPTATNAPFRGSVLVYDLTGHLIGRRGFPAPWLEIKIAGLAGRPVLDLH